MFFITQPMWVLLQPYIPRQRVVFNLFELAVKQVDNTNIKTQTFFLRKGDACTEDKGLQGTTLKYITNTSRITSRDTRHNNQLYSILTQSHSS
jgi:hypothetical protein